MRNRIVAIAAALAIAVPALAGTAGAPAPQFNLASRGGKDVSLAQYQGPGRDDQFLGELVRAVPPGDAAAREHI